MLATQDIEMAQQEGLCAHTAIINLFKLRERQAPSLGIIKTGLAYMTALRDPQANELTDPNAADVVSFLAAYDFLCAVITVPASCFAVPQKVLTRFLDEGCQLLIFFNWHDAAVDSIFGHVALAEGYSEQGFQVIDGEPPYLPEGAPFELEQDTSKLPEGIDSAWYDRQTHGSRRTLPFYSVNPEGVGMLAHVVVVYPDWRSGADTHHKNLWLDYSCDKEAERHL